MNNLKNLFWEPSLLFKELKEKPTWLLPFIIICVVSIIFAFIMQPVQTQLMILNIPEDSVASMIEQTNKFKLVGFSLIPLFTILKLAIVSGLLLLGTYIVTDKLKFKQIFSVVCWSNIILLLGGILNVFILYLKGVDTINDPTDMATVGLNIFFNTKSLGVALNALLSEISVFSIWYIVLITIGLMIVGELSKGKAIFVSVFIWLITVGFKVGLTAFGNQFSL